MSGPLAPRRLAVALAVGLALAGGAAADEEATLDRPETHVVVRGEQLGRLLDERIDHIRVYAARGGSLRAIPFQVDERTSQDELVFDEGLERRTDTDDRFDANDELLFMARDAGDRVPRDRINLGQRDYHELELGDPLDRGRAWVYVFAFDNPPPASPRDYVELEWSPQGELVGWTGDGFRCEADPDGINLLDLRSLEFALGEDEGWGPDVLDRAKVVLRASYLFTEIVRHVDEFRCGLLSWRDGPVRVTGRFALEAYLIWGHWIRPAGDCLITLYGNRLELRLDLRNPVDLERDVRSELRLSLDFAPSSDAVRVWSDRNPRRWRGGSQRTQTLRQFDRSFPEWVCASFPTGSLLVRVRPGRGIRRGDHRLFLADGDAPDPPEDHPGSLANAGVVLDLTGLEEGRYELAVDVQVGPPIFPGEEDRLQRVETPLQCRAIR